MDDEDSLICSSRASITCADGNSGPGLTVLGVIIGTASIVVMVSLGIGLKENTVESYASFGSLTRIQISSGYREPVRGRLPRGRHGDEACEDPACEESVSPILETDVNLKQGVYQGYSNIVGMPREGWNRFRWRRKTSGQECGDSGIYRRKYGFRQLL